MELQNSTFICALNVVERSGQYGTIHRLSTVIIPLLVHNSKVKPKSSGERRLYVGYPSFPVWVYFTNARGYLLVHFLSFIHGYFGLCTPHGPWIIVALIISCNFGSRTGSGISALMNKSIWFGDSFFCNQSNIWPWGRPLFYILQRTYSIVPYRMPSLLLASPWDIWVLI